MSANSSQSKVIILILFCLGIMCPSLFSAAVDIAPIHEAFVPKFADPLPLLTISQTPPSPRADNIPSKPYDDAIWIPGYWAWVPEKNDFSWICGVWRRPPPSAQFWIPGSWNKTDAGWVYAKGFWSPVPQNQLKLINKAPPAVITDKVPTAPSVDYFWAPGYWNYSEGSSSYSWLSGKWEQSNPNWVLSPSSYIWRPSGFIFAPLYWDRPLDQRGAAYNCQGNSGPLVVVKPEIILQRLFVFYPDYSLFYWHWWHYHPNWAWDGCGCVPSWWLWHDWWFLGWSDCWGLWWWWTHPGVLPPWWLTLELSSHIAPPPDALVELLKNLPKPPFDIKPGYKILPPTGSPGVPELPLPNIPSDVTPGGQITLPTPPATSPPQVTVPTPPSTPPQYQEPERPYYPPTPQPPPSTYYPPQQQVPPSTYYPPSEPPSYYPPGRYPYPPSERTPPRWPPRGQGDDQQDERTPPRPNYPNTPPRPNYPTNPKNPTTPPSNRGPNYTPGGQVQPRNPVIPQVNQPNYVPPPSSRGRNNPKDNS